METTGKSETNLVFAPPRQLAGSQSEQWQVKLLSTSLAGVGVDGDLSGSKASRLADNLMPMAIHMARYHHLPQAQTLCFVHVESKGGLRDFATSLVNVLKGFSGSSIAWIPLVGSHSLLLNALRLIAKELSGLDLSRAPLLYIGDYANFTTVREIAHSCHMPVFCQATY